jgi:hypothetical protein
MKKKEYIKQNNTLYLNLLSQELSANNDIKVNLYPIDKTEGVITIQIDKYYGQINVNEDYPSLSNEDFLTLGIELYADDCDTEEETSHIWQLSALATEENNLYYWTTIEEAAEALINIIKKNS